jgi:hypothetical protein
MVSVVRMDKTWYDLILPRRDLCSERCGRNSVSDLHSVFLSHDYRRDLFRQVAFALGQAREGLLVACPRELYRRSKELHAHPLSNSA